MKTTLKLTIFSLQTDLRIARALAPVQSGLHCSMDGEQMARSRPIGYSPASELCSAPSQPSCGCLSWAMAQLPSRTLFPSDRLCCFNSQACSHDIDMLSTSFAYRKHPFLGDWIYRALFWCSGQLQPKLSLIRDKWSSYLLPQPELTQLLSASLHHVLRPQWQPWV